MVISLTKKNPEKKIHFKAFNSTYFELLKMMKENSDNNRDFKRFYNQNLFIKNTNIKMFIRTWYQNITCFYKEQIMSGDIDYFVKKDYSSEINENEEFANSYSIESYIQYFKGIYETLQEEDVNAFIEKVQQLTHLSYLYYS